MSIFNFSNLIKPENSGNPVKTETTKLRASEPSFKDLVKKIVDEKHAASQESKSEPMSVAAPVPVEMPVEKKPEPVKVREEIVVVPENLPAIPEPEEIVNFQPVILNTEKETEETHVEIKQNEKLSGRELVTDFLDELNKLMLAGQELNSLSAERANLSDESKSKLDELNKQLADSKEIKSAMEVLLSKASNENVQAKMLDSVKSIEIAIDALVGQLQNEEGSARKSDSALLIQLNGQKTAINKLTEMIGGKNKFDTLREYVKKSEYVAERHISKKFSEDFQNQPKAREVIVDAILETINFVRTDSHLAKEMVSNGDLMSILLATFQNKVQK